MNRTAVPFLSLFLASLLLGSADVSAHPGHPHEPTSRLHSDAADRGHDFGRDGQVSLAQAEVRDAATGVPAVSGQGDLTFRVLYTSSHLPAEAADAAVLTRAHGGFAVDRRPGKGEIYFALPGAGIIEIGADLSQTRLIATPPEMKDTNMHNTSIWYATDGTPYLVFPGNDIGKVFTTTIEGELVNILGAPTPGDNLDEPVVTVYFNENKKFVPTDVDELGGLYYITTGYSDLDYVLTAKIAGNKPMTITWNDLAFGGRGSGAGQFGTGHGITITPDRSRVSVADRPNAEIDRFTRYGHYRDTVKLPEGSFPCDIDYVDEYAVVGCLHGPDRSKGAPIYILKGDELVSTIMPKEELGLANFTHIHNAVGVKIDGRLHIIAQAWNPGDFAILEQVAP
ncbi:MAG: hypothetical protein AMXMBFR4_25950 [Candidatus Hydrogenedentota bacterium]